MDVNTDLQKVITHSTNSVIGSSCSLKQLSPARNVGIAAIKGIRDLAQKSAAESLKSSIDSSNQELSVYY